VQTRIDEEKPNHSTLVTIHVTHLSQKEMGGLFRTKEYNPPAMILELYNKFLKNDTLLHYFFEPDLIIRVSNNEVREQIKNYLSSKNISYEVYDYPSPPQAENKKRYGEHEDGVVIQRLYDVYLPLFHLNAVAALTMDEFDKMNYLERSTHTFCNMTGQTRLEEAETLSYLASLKLPQVNPMEQLLKRS
jgi:hypothetical protein